MAFSSVNALGGLLRRAAPSGGGSSGGNSTAGAGKPKGPDPADLENMDVEHFLGYIWVAFVTVFILYQFTFHFIRYLRTVACLNNETQRYFAKPHVLFATFRKHCLDAPLFRTRHHREFKLSTAINIGTLPSRLQTFLLVGYFATNVGFCVWSINFKGAYAAVAGELRNRTGVMAVINMIPLFLLAGRNNPVIKLTGISFDTMNLIHRWFGRIVVLEAITHTLAWMIPKVHTSMESPFSQFENKRLQTRRGMGRRSNVHNPQQLHHDWLHGHCCFYFPSDPVALSSSTCLL